MGERSLYRRERAAASCRFNPLNAVEAVGIAAKYFHDRRANIANARKKLCWRASPWYSSASRYSRRRVDDGAIMTFDRAGRPEYLHEPAGASAAFSSSPTRRGASRRDAAQSCLRITSTRSVPHAPACAFRPTTRFIAVR